MNEDTELSENVVTAIKRNRKIDAIKLLREERELGLKEAKEVVDAYVAAHSELQTKRPSSAGFNMVPLLLAAVVTAILYFAFNAQS